MSDTIIRIAGSIVLTAASYMAFPLLRLLINRGKFDGDKAKRIALWNSIVVGVIFCTLTSAFYTDGTAWNAAPAVLYYWINRALLTAKSAEHEDKAPSAVTVQEEPAEPQLRFCRKCGRQLEPDARFCSQCGGDVRVKAPAEAPRNSNRTWKWICICAAVVLLLVAGGIILENSNLGGPDYYYDSTDPGAAPSADTVNPNDKKSYDVTKIEIAADSASGVGDVYSSPIHHPDYHIFDSWIGQTYHVNYKIIGGIGEHLTLVGNTVVPYYGPVDDWWYNVVLPDGTTGFVWGGTDGMYIDEIG